jgi:hypothetical protein
VPGLGVSSTSHGSNSRKARKTHKDLHGEVLGTDAPAEELVQLAIVRPQTETHARGRVRSGTVSSHHGLRQNISSSPGSLPPVPPLPVSNLTARQDGLPITVVATRDLADRPVFSHIGPPTLPPPNEDERLVVQSNTITSANSSQRRDHTRHRQSHRPRDSLILEKARFLDHFHLCKLFSQWRNCHPDILLLSTRRTTVEYVEYPWEVYAPLRIFSVVFMTSGLQDSSNLSKITALSTSVSFQRVALREH